MNKRILSPHHLSAFRQHLTDDEKSPVTIEKYLRDATVFFHFSAGREVTKALTLAYKQHLQDSGYAVRSVNSMLAAMNSLLTDLGWDDCKVKNLRCQRPTYRAANKELTKADYLLLLQAAQPNPQLRLILQTICATGIRVSELRYFTVEAIQHGEISVRCKNKIRTILLPEKLRCRLLSYAKDRGILEGAIFLSKAGSPIDRSSIWAQMKRLAAAAGVDPDKVYPHNLRKLFARTFYGAEKDIAKLADILGHSSIDTTRIYIMTTGVEHRKKLDRLGLVV